MSTDPVSMTFTNSTSQTFDECSADYTGWTVQKGVGTISQMPSSVLTPGASTSMVMDQNFLANFASGGAWMSLGWKNPNDGYHFGIKIIIPVQVLHMGDRPYYQVSDGSSGTPSWRTPVSDPSMSCTFGNEFSISVTPNSTHTGLTLKAVISNK